MTACENYTGHWKVGILLFFVELCKSFPKWNRWSLYQLHFKRYCTICFLWRNCKCQVIADVSRSKKNVKCKLNFIFNILSDYVITFVRNLLIHKIENIANLRKTFFFRKRGCLCMHNCAEILDATNIYYTV